MKIICCLLIIFTTNLFAQIDKNVPKIVEVSCGQCQFGMKPSGCDLAIRIDGKCYFVDGTKIDDHGNAHAQDGFCSTIRKAEVIGEIIGGQFRVNSFKLIPFKKL